MGICMVSDTWVILGPDVRNGGLRQLGFRTGGSALPIKIATVHPGPTPWGALLDPSNLYNHHPAK